ncbi:MAG: hypothetical protein IT173_14320 [Acidobacteria bacterium]|nr:hypothetical protein [Acidobacteriota bacterium]
MRGLRIILDKSAVFGLGNEEIDSLDRYFFQVVPQILVNEIIADLTKELAGMTKRIAAHTYRVSGNQGLAFDHRKRLVASLQGREAPMDGRFMASREKVVRTASGSLASLIETPLEDELLARWERQEFTDTEREWAQRFRTIAERPLATELYLAKIESAGLSFAVPTSDEELANSVKHILSDIRMVTKLFEILEEDFQVPPAVLRQAGERWRAQGPSSFGEFAPFALFCLKASFMWHLSLTNTRLFGPNKNDRKDLEYSYYLPGTQIFATKDTKQFRLMSFLTAAHQSVVDADDLKRDLRRVSEDWNRMSISERIEMNERLGSAPPEVFDSLVYQLWRKHDGELKPSMHAPIAKTKWIDDSLPADQQVPFTMAEFVKKKYQEVREGKPLLPEEVDALNLFAGSTDPISILVFNSRISRERAVKWYPNLTLDDMDDEIMNEIYLDPREYKNIVSIGE